ncbi:MAG: esterase/lipase family protein [Candidatus Berkiella sp.]
MKNELVILLHGIARTSRSMRTIEKALIKHGYRVANIDYPSRKATIAQLTAYVDEKIKALSIDENTTVHFVTYSMGCLILRELLAHYPIKPSGRIVFLGPPHQG